MNKHQKQSKNSAFTIVELLIVVVVIAILAAITIVAYSGIQKQAVRASVQSALSSASTAMKLEAVKSSAGFTSIPDNVKPSDRVGLALTELPPPASSETSFCMNGTYMGHNDVAYHTTEADDIKEGLCEGDVLPDTIVGEYNYEAGGADPDAPKNLISAVTVEGDLYGFKVATNRAWDEATISWSPQQGVTRYEVQSNIGSAGNSAGWAYRLADDGSGAGNYQQEGYSGQIPVSVSSLVWTDLTYGVPNSPTQGFHYRMRPCSGPYTANCSAWTTVTLSNPVQTVADVPSVENFSVTPSSDWSRVDMSWKRSDNYSSNMGITRYEVQSNIGSAGNSSGWMYRLTEDGSGSANYQVTTHSGQVPINTTSLSWTDKTYAVPYSPGQIYHFRIRTCANVYNSLCSTWSTVSLENPIQSASQIPAVTGFKVTPSTNWSSVALSWDKSSNYTTDMGAARYEVRSNSSTTATSSAWGYRQISDGSGLASYQAETHSGQIPNGTTSITWTNRDYAVPYSPRQIYHYQIRNCVGPYQNFCGAWTTISLENPIQSASQVPAVTGLAVTPASNWSSVNISWNAVPNYSTNMGIARYELQSNPTSGATTSAWAYRSIADGSGSGGYQVVGHSGQIALGTTSLTWTDPAYGVPQSSGKIYHYRLRTCADLYQNVCGPWSTVSLPYSN